MQIVYGRSIGFRSRFRRAFKTVKRTTREYKFSGYRTISFLTKTCLPLMETYLRFRTKRSAVSSVER